MYMGAKKPSSQNVFNMTQKLPQICTVILPIRIGKAAWFSVYICGNFWISQYYGVQFVKVSWARFSTNGVWNLAKLAETTHFWGTQG